MTERQPYWTWTITHFDLAVNIHHLWVTDCRTFVVRTLIALNLPPISSPLINPNPRIPNP
jgi:hypothetical protein